MGRRVGLVPSSGTLMLDSEGVAKAARGDRIAQRSVEQALTRGMSVVVSAITLTEVLRDRPQDAPIHRLLSKVTQLPVTSEIARKAGGLLGGTGLDGHRCAIDAVVAATALAQPRPVILLTSDPGDLSKLVEEPERDKRERIHVFTV
jgi:predicted nucleic acid-binding protein